LLVVALLYFGLQPHLVLDLSSDTLSTLLNIAKELRP